MIFFYLLRREIMLHTSYHRSNNDVCNELNLTFQPYSPSSISWGFIVIILVILPLNTDELLNSSSSNATAIWKLREHWFVLICLQGSRLSVSVLVFVSFTLSICASFGRLLRVSDGIQPESFRQILVNGNGEKASNCYILPSCCGHIA